MAVRELSRMSWEEARDLDRSRTVAILPVGAVEAHGPHLPLSTDVVIAEAMARAGAQRLAALGREALLLPPLAYTAAGFAAGFPGTVSLDPGTVTEIVLGVARSLGRHGFPLLLLANAHLDPAHLGALRLAEREAEIEGEAELERGGGIEREAAEEGGTARDDGGTARIVFPDLTRRPWALRLGEEFRTGACHAGRFEGSVVMAAAPAWTRPDIAASLPAVESSLSEAIRAGKRSFEEAGGPRAYFGWPADATAEEGRERIRALGEILRDAVLEAEGALDPGMEVEVEVEVDLKGDAGAGE